MDGMSLIILHDLDDDEVLVNTDEIVAARVRTPDSRSRITDAYTRLFFTSKTLLGMPDSVKETPAEIYALSRK